MKKIGLFEFTRRLRSLADNHENKIVFFIGAGCSISSGIPSAANLTKEWIKVLKMFEVGDSISFDEWISSGERYKNYSDENSSAFYANVINDLFPDEDQRQKEIERIVTQKDPRFGYATLASLLSDTKFGINFNKILTTNFDDLIADALYLYTNKKPLVITHESLIDFATLSSIKPTIIKLHGDAQLNPKNIESETAKIDERVKEKVISIVRESYVIFTGYGGNDTGIKEIFKNVTNLKSKVYWVNHKIPKTDFGKWLENTEAIWVDHLDFDLLMMSIFIEFELIAPEFKSRFDQLQHSYKKRSDKLELSFNESLDNLNVQISKEPSEEKRKKLSELQQKTVRRSRLGIDYEMVWSQGRWIIISKLLKAGDKIHYHF
jgi:hypothetical protein